MTPAPPDGWDPGPAWAAAAAGPFPVSLIVYGVTPGGTRCTVPIGARLAPAGGALEMTFLGFDGVPRPGSVEVLRDGDLGGFVAELLAGVALTRPLDPPPRVRAGAVLALAGSPPRPDWSAITRAVSG